MLINVNIPYINKSNIAEPEIIVCEQGHYEPSMNDIVECMDPRGRPYYWIGPPENNTDSYVGDTDISHILEDKITVTPLSLNLTHKPTLKMLEDVFKA